MRLFHQFIIMLSIPLISCAQEDDKEIFNPDNYINSRKVSQENRYYIYSYYKKDTNYRLEELYIDKAYKWLLNKIYYHKNTPVGPYVAFVNNDTSRTGYFINGKSEGIWKTFSQGKIIEIGKYSKGKRVGEWKEFNKSGKLILKEIYDKDGNLIESTEY